MNKTDRFGTPIKEGDYVIFTSYGDMYLGKIDKLCNVRHLVQRCDNSGTVRTYTNSWNGETHPYSPSHVSQNCMVKMDVDTAKGTVRMIKKMTL